jgi:hypothetical protein
MQKKRQYKSLKYVKGYESMLVWPWRQNLYWMASQKRKKKEKKSNRCGKNLGIGRWR